MKKFCVWTGCILTVFGIILSWEGTRLGGASTASVHLFGRTWQVTAPFSMGAHTAVDYAATPQVSAGTEYVVAQEVAPTWDTVSGGYEATDMEPFSSIYLNLDVAEVTIAAGDCYGLSVDSWGSGYTIDHWCSNGGELTIESSGVHFPGKYGANILIYVPIGVKLDAINIDHLDLGSVTLEGLNVMDIYADLSLGSLTGEGLTVYGDVNVQADLGEVVLSGTFGEVVNIYADLGNVELMLSNPESEYSWDLIADLGSVCVDSSVRGTNKHVRGGNGNHVITVDAALGSITVNFDETMETSGAVTEAEVWIAPGGPNNAFDAGITYVEQDNTVESVE